MKPKPPQDLWEKMDVIHASVPNDEGFTIAEYCQKYNFPHRTGYDRVQRLLHEGKLVQGYRRNRVTGHTTKVYRPK